MEQIAGLPLSPVSGPTLCRSQRRIRGRVRPRTAADVAAVVRACAEQRWPLHPVSGGKNWGMGSYLPDHDDCVLLDLSALKTIGPIDRDAGSVRIEAGVTQKELYDWLQREAPEFAFNVTGAGKDTSIVGNALERGLGYLGSRAGEIFGCAAVLADGTEVGPDPAWFSRTGCIPAGPQTEVLLAQGNFGVVTSGWLKLRRRQELEAAVVISGEFEPVFETVRRAMERNVLTLPVHMGGGSRLDGLGLGFLRQLWDREPSVDDVRRIFPLSRGHTALGALHGPKRLVRAAVAELRSLAAPGTVIRVVTDARFRWAERWCSRFGLRDKATFFAALRPLFALTWGEANDAGLAALGMPLREVNPDRLGTGCIYLNAVTAPRVEASRAVERLLAEHAPDHAVTRCFEGRMLVHVMSIFFPPEAAADAQDRARSLARAFRAQGWPPYRLGQVTMEAVPGVLAARLRAALDPHHLIAPGHYLA